MKYMDTIDEIGGIGNVYGGLVVGESEGKYYFAVEHYPIAAKHFTWEEISEELYNELIKHNNK